MTLIFTYELTQTNEKTEDLPMSYLYLYNPGNYQLHITHSLKLLAFVATRFHNMFNRKYEGCYHRRRKTGR
jgi:hypothetical protein